MIHSRKLAKILETARKHGVKSLKTPDIEFELEYEAKPAPAPVPRVGVVLTPAEAAAAAQDVVNKTLASVPGEEMPSDEDFLFMATPFKPAPEKPDGAPNKPNNVPAELALTPKRKPKAERAA